MTLIEILADHIDDHEDGLGQPHVNAVLVPEQCMEVYHEGKYYHVTVEEITEDNHGS